MKFRVTSWLKVAALVGMVGSTSSASPQGEPPPGNCDCCGARPPIVDNPGQPFVPFAPGIVSAVTNSQTGPNDPAVYLVELGNEGAAPLGANWGTQRYSHPSWMMSKLGHVFGVTIDDKGNTYVGHTSCYGGLGADLLGSLGGAGSIYLLDGTTGVASELIRLPNNIDPAIAVNNPNEAYPGLGNLTFQCSTGRLFAANLEDGRIYSIDPNGGASKVKSVYDIASGAIAGPLPNNGLAEPGDAPGWVPLGERPYALKTRGNRLFYSVWNSSLYAGPLNTIRSVGLTATGDFIAGSDQLEIVLPPWAGYPSSNPVVDLTFDGNCCLFAAERGINDIYTYPHSSRVLRYCEDAAAGTTWQAVPFEYQVGGQGGVCSPPFNSSAGGVGVDSTTNLVWTMADAMGGACQVANPLIYGIEGQVYAGAPQLNSILVDIDGILTSYQKNYLGSLEITCPDACAKLNTTEIICGPNNTYTWTFTFTNTSGSTASVLILPDPSMSPNVIPLNPPVLSGGTSAPITVTITGQQPGTQFCFDFILGDIKGDVCCHLEPCIDLPDCECAQVSHVGITGTPTAGTFQMSFTFTNLSAWSTGHLVFIPPIGSTIAPSILNVGPIAPFGSQNVGPVTIASGLAPGSQYCFTLGNHSANWAQCCFIEVCVTVPSPSPQVSAADLNGDGKVNAMDLAILLGDWGKRRSPADLDHGGLVDAPDLGILLGAWTG